MPSLGVTLRDILVNAVFHGMPFTSPTAFYLALFNGDPTPNGTGPEVNGQAYVRQQITAFTNPVNGEVENTEKIVFPVAASDWGNISHYGIFDAQTGGNLLFFGQFSITKPIFTGDQFSIDVGALKIRFE